MECCTGSPKAGFQARRRIHRSSLFISTCLRFKDEIL
jgi:hypothetical protein